tara:strand:+ start:227 stop:637 length:411 start_codon:yes stop_codon:yes gene_type:complete
MPNYVFKHPDKDIYEEVFFHMKDEPKEYIDEEGLKWQRVWSLPQLNTVGQINHWDNADFVNKTANKKGSYGDMLDLSAELSDKRAKDHGGIDPIKQDYYKKYSEKRGGKKHLQEVKENIEKGNKGVNVDFSNGRQR